MSAGISSDQRRKEQGNQGMFGPSFGQQSNYNYFPNNGDNYNAWGSQHEQQQQQHQHSSAAGGVGRGRGGGSSYDDYYRNRDDGIKSIEHGVQGMGLDSHRSQSDGNYRDAAVTHSSSNASTKSQEQPKESSSAPKKMTWASIASQPAKPQIRDKASSSTLKKKGPGMPPPPIIDLDANWDSPKNGPAMVLTPVPVPSPPPPIIDGPSPLAQSLSKSHNNNDNNANHTSNNVNSRNNTNMAGATSNNNNNNNMNKNNENNNLNNNNHNNSNNNAPHSQLSNNNQYPHHSPSSMQQHGRDRDRDGPNMHQRQNWHGLPNRGPPVHSGGMYHHAPPPQQHRPNYGPSGQGPAMNYHHGPPNHGPYGGGMNRPSYRSPQSSHPHGPNSYSNNKYPDKGFGSAPAPPHSGSSAGPIQNHDSMPQPRDSPPAAVASDSEIEAKQVVLEELRVKNNYNPSELDMEGFDNARFFIIKSYSEDDIHRSIKYEIWCSTEHGNKRLDEAFRQRKDDDSNIYLLFSVNGSGHFCGMAQMMTAVDYNSVSSVWHQDKWKGQFKVKWIYVKDVPNAQLRHIRLENNENKPVTNSRDTQEVPNAKGQQVLQIIHAFKHTTSIFDDFTHYEQRQVEEGSRKIDDYDDGGSVDNRNGPYPNHYHGSSSNYQSGGPGSARGGYGGGNNYENKFDKSGHGNYRGRVGNNFGPGGGNRGYHNSYDGPVPQQHRSNYDNRRGPGDDYHPRSGGFGDRPNREYRDIRRDDRRDDHGGGFMSRNRDPPRDFDQINRGYEYRERNGEQYGPGGGGGYKGRSGLPPRDREITREPAPRDTDRGEITRNINNNPANGGTRSTGEEDYRN